MNGECTRATTKAKIGRRKRRGQEGKEGWRAICDGRALGNKGSTNGCSIKNIDRIAGVLQDDKTSRGKGFYQLLCAHEPKKPSSSGSVIVHVATVNQDMGNLVNMVIPGIHGNAKEKDAKCPAHLNTIMECKRGAEGGANFMEDATFFFFNRWLQRISRILAVLGYEGNKQATPVVLRPRILWRT